jgi:mannose-6-phosphate isomerase-like protein (cupin superfamily)
MGLGACGAGASGVGSREARPPTLPPVSGTAPETAEVSARVAAREFAMDERWAAPSTACQDVLLYVREGTLDVYGTGIADPRAPARLNAGDAVRFGPEGDGVVRNVGAGRAQTVVVVARRPDRGAPRVPADPLAQARLREEDAVACPLESDAGVPATNGDPRRDVRVTRASATPEHIVAGGALRVRILLDRAGHGAAYAGLSLLDGDADLRVPEHRHAESAEILYVEEGDGLMRLGDGEVRVRAGAVLVVPRGVLHDFRGANTRPLRALQVYAPSGPEQRFRQ